MEQRTESCPGRQQQQLLLLLLLLLLLRCSTNRPRCPWAFLQSP